MLKKVSVGDKIVVKNGDSKVKYTVIRSKCGKINDRNTRIISCTDKKDLICRFWI